MPRSHLPMREDLTDLLEKADLAVASCAGVIEESELAPVIETVRAVRTRLAYPDDVLVVAFAGGTGSGKSSLFNALTGEDLVDTGGVRPTTSRPASAAPADAADAIEGYLDRLGIDDRHVHEGSGLCLIDLPDTDSVEVEHRHRVDAILPLVDIVVWVTDPQKYRDSRLHDDYLKPMAEYSRQFIVVVNQIDRLTADEVEEVCTDLETALEEDWLEEAVIVPVAAAPPSGPPIGLDDLREAFDHKREGRHTLFGKLLTDLAATSRQLASEAGSGLDFDSRAGEALDRAAVALSDGDGQRAFDVLAGFLDTLAVETGGITSEQIEMVAADVPAHVRRIEGELAAHPPPARRRWLRKTDPEPDPAQQSETGKSLLSEAVIRPVRAILARRAVAVASVAELAVEVESLRSMRRR